MISLVSLADHLEAEEYVDHVCVQAVYCKHNKAKSESSFKTFCDFEPTSGGA